MIWYDFVILAILVYTAWSGAQRGLITQLAWIAALVLCFKFADKLAPAIEPQINVEQPLKHWIAMFVLYLGFSLGSFMGARILTSWVEKAKIKDFDRHLGGLFGLLKGIIIALVVTFFAVTLSQSLKATVLQSKTGYAACVILDNVEPLTPEYFHEYLAKYREELSPLHDTHDHLGQGSSTIPDLWGNNSTTPSSGTGSTEQGGGLNLPNLWNELAGSVDGGTTSDGFGSSLGSGTASPSGPAEIANAPSFDEMWRRLPQQMKQQFGSQMQQQWDSATPEQKRNLVGDLGRSMGFEVPNVVSQFLTDVNPLNNTQQPGGGTNFTTLLNQIGDIYQDRSAITARTQEYLAGVPPEVQSAVIADWHADLTMRSTDPDPATDVNTKLDERILRQLDRSGVSWNRLSFELRQRLNLSRQ